MKKIKALVLIGLLFIPLNIFAFDSNSQEKDLAKGHLLLREAKEFRKTYVAVEGYLIGNVLEVTVTARMKREKPRIFSVILVGPGVNRMSAKERKTVFAQAEGEKDVFSTEDVGGGFISFSKKTKEKTLKGTLTRELHRFIIPTDKIVPNKRYQLWVKVESMKEAGEIRTFKFDLSNLAQLVCEK